MSETSPRPASPVPAPPPGAVQAPPSRDDRILVGAAYLSMLVGLWFFAPLALYFWKGRSSRFVAFHAVQAILLRVSMVPMVVAANLLAATANPALGAVLDRHGKWFEALDALAISAPIGVAAVVPFFLTVGMGISAMRGNTRALPLIGRWAKQIVATA